MSRPADGGARGGSETHPLRSEVFLQTSAPFGTGHPFGWNAQSRRAISLTREHLPPDFWSV